MHRNQNAPPIADAVVCRVVESWTPAGFELFVNGLTKLAGESRADFTREAYADVVHTEQKI
jgi:hypothetical protein